MISTETSLTEVAQAIWVRLAWKEAAGVTPTICNHTLSIAVLLHYSNTYTFWSVGPFEGTLQRPGA
jgi:hypothetical protein